MCKKERILVVAAIVAAFAVAMFCPMIATAGGIEIPPAWEQKLNASKRFEVVLDGEAVLDKETGLVWERSPSATYQTWRIALWECNVLKKGNRMGWRLPTVQELTSLVDPTVMKPSLPVGHPFSFSSTTYPGSLYPFEFWTANTDVESADRAWVVVFVDYGHVTVQTKSSGYGMWCVRSGQGSVDVQ
jgi:hypothetical protein